LRDRGVAETVLEEIESEVAEVIEDAVRFADESPEPALAELKKHVYVE
jgi:TPP-dependent pyruvate/acetoin dehydrogenase alpha subunit